MIETIISYGATVLTCLSVATGFVAAYCWYKSTKIALPAPPVAGGTIYASTFQDLWAAVGEANYNRKGAGLTAAALVMQYLAALSGQ